MNNYHMRRSFWHRVSVAAIILSLLTVASATAADWPMWRYDAQRGGYSPHALSSTQLSLVWQIELPTSKPAWPPSQEKLGFDHLPHAVVVDQTIFVTSNVNDSLTAHDTRTGKRLWRFYADGPIRLAPLAASGKIYFVADDGYLYCLRAEDGQLEWKFRGGPEERWVLGNERLISSWPARGGPVWSNGRVYFAASIWPFMGIFIHCVDAETGELIWTNSGDGTNLTIQPHNAPSFATVAPQGHLAVAGDRLIVPGGRSVPAVFDIRDGRLLHFSYDKRRGGHAVAVSDNHFFVGGGTFSVERGEELAAEAWHIVGPKMLLTVEENRLVGVRPKFTVELEDRQDRKGQSQQVVKRTREMLFNLPLDVEVDQLHCQAGTRVYSSGGAQIHAFSVDRARERAAAGGRLAPAWTGNVGGVDAQVGSMLAADDRLFVMTTDCRLLCFGEEGSQAPHVNQAKPRSSSPVVAEKSPWDEVVEKARGKRGYAVVFGLGDGRLARHLVDRTSLNVVVIEEQPRIVREFRRGFDAEGVYGQRLMIRQSPYLEAALPPYLASSIMHELLPAEPVAGGFLRKLFESLRPYGGTATLRATDAQHEEIVGLMQPFAHEGASVERDDGFTVIVREGPLPGAGKWTHQYADAAQTGISSDRLIRAPLGILWFGGPANDRVLPRHGHGPSPQAVGGRVIIEGPDMLRALDAFTGRLLWERDLPGLGQYYDTTRHFAGAGEIGSNYVSLQDRVYVVYGSTIMELDAATGETQRQFPLAENSRYGQQSWGFIACWNDLLAATSTPVTVDKDQDEAAEPQQSANGRVAQYLAPTRYASASRRLVVFDRATGKRLWQRNARFSFRHNSIAIGAGKVFCIDGLSSAKRAALARRGAALEDSTLYALDAYTGDVVWQTRENVFGTFLNYSAAHDILLQGGSQFKDRAYDEAGMGLIAYAGADGTVLWQDLQLQYSGPCLLWQDSVITNGNGGFALDIRTGKPTGWSYRREYGCNTAIGSQHLLTFRSGAAGFCDLANDSGTGNIGGFRSSCTNNLIPAEGLLLAPDYTRTCSCAYQNQTSLALVHMPAAEYWTFGSQRNAASIGLNFGAPGDRRGEDGMLWVEWPAADGTSPEIQIETEPTNCDVFRKHSSAVFSDPLRWVAASGLVGVKRIKIHVDRSAAGKLHELELVFLEPEDVRQRQRVFDVFVQGDAAARDLDIVRRAGGRDVAYVVRTRAVPIAGQIELQFTAGGELPAIISGVGLSVAD